MVAWSVAEELKLKKHYPDMSIKELAKLFPRRTYRGVQTKAVSMGLRKYTKNVRFVNGGGYVVVRCDDYPKDWAGVWLGRETGTYVYEHCLVWYKNYPYSKIEKGEIVHHVDGNRANNNINNLRKMTRSEHTRNTVLDEWEDVIGVEGMMFPF